MSPRRVLWGGLSVALMTMSAGVVPAAAAEGGDALGERATATVDRYAAGDGGGGEFSALGLCNYNGGHPTLGLGSRGLAVSHLQCILRNFHGHTGLAVDGVFGSGTRASVIWFQAVNGLPADGIVGPRTWDRLHAV